MASDEWSVIFYVDENGNEPVRKFLDSLDLKTQARFAWSIEQLRIRNIKAREPLVRHLEGKIWELREESSTDIYRLLYFYMDFKRRNRKLLAVRLKLHLNEWLNLQKEVNQH